jgi:hypothetical protein
VAVASATGLDARIADQFREAGYEVDMMELPSLGDNEDSGSDEGSDDESGDMTDSDGDEMSVRSG